MWCMYYVLPLKYCPLSPMRPYCLTSVLFHLFVYSYSLTHILFPPASLFSPLSSYFYSLVSILVLQGAAPNWRPVLSLPFKAPQDDFTPANLTQVRDIVTFTLFDQVSHTPLQPPSTHIYISTPTSFSPTSTPACPILTPTSTPLR